MNETEILKIHGYVFSLSDCDTSDSEDDHFITYGGKEATHATNNSGRSSSLSDFDDEYYAVQPPPIRIDDYKHLIVKIKAVSEQKDDTFSKNNSYAHAVRATERKKSSTAVRNPWKKLVHLNTQDVENFRISLAEFPPLRPQRHTAVMDRKLGSEDVNEIKYAAVAENFNNSSNVEDSVQNVENCNGDAKSIPIAPLDSTHNKTNQCKEFFLNDQLLHLVTDINLNVENDIQQQNNFKSIPHTAPAILKISDKIVETNNNSFLLKSHIELQTNENNTICTFENNENMRPCVVAENISCNNLDYITQETDNLLLVKMDSTSTKNTAENLQTDCTNEDNDHNCGCQVLPENTTSFNSKNKINQIPCPNNRLDMNNSVFESGAKKRLQDVTIQSTKRPGKNKLQNDCLPIFNLKNNKINQIAFPNNRLRQPDLNTNISNNCVFESEAKKRSQDVTIKSTKRPGKSNLQNDCLGKPIFNVRNNKINQITPAAVCLSRSSNLNVNNANCVFKTQTKKSHNSSNNTMTEKPNKCNNFKSQNPAKDNCTIIKSKVDDKVSYLPYNRLSANNTAAPNFKKMYVARDNRAAFTRKRIAAGRRCKRSVEPSLYISDLFAILIFVLLSYLLWKIFTCIFL